MKQKKPVPRDTVGGRLYTLYVQSGLSLEKFAQVGGVSRAAMLNYARNERKPDTDMIKKICKHFSVSADWLLGLSDVKEPSADLRAVCEYTGLSEKAIQIIRDNDGRMRDTVTSSLSDLVESDHFMNLLVEYDYFLDALESLTVEDLKELVPYSGADGKVELGRNATVLFFRNNVVSLMTSICSNKYQEVTSKLNDGSLIFYSNGDGRSVAFDKKTLEQYKPENENIQE